jgi:hypothetical protein
MQGIQEVNIMKLFRNIAIGLIALFIIAIAGAYIYFTDARLKSIFLPIASETLGTEVTASSMSLSLFRHFPSASVEVRGLAFGDTLDKPLQDMESMAFAVKIFPLFSNKLDIARLQIDKPNISYIVFDDGTTNLDPIMDALNDTTAVGADQQGWEIDLRRIVLNEAIVTYDNKPDTLLVVVPQLNLDATLQLADVINSTFNARVAGMSIDSKGSNIVSNFSLGLEQESVIDLDNETVSLNAGNLLFGDFRLGLTGMLSNWSEALMLDLKLASSSSDFSELLNLLPPDTRAQFANYESRGAFNIEGTVLGEWTDNNLPQFDLKASIQDGYLKDKNLPTAIQNINLQFTATNDLIDLSDLRANAGANKIEGKGVIRNPLDSKKGTLIMNVLADLDLGTVKDFYDIKQSGIEQMRGKLNVDADIDALLSDLASGRFDANFLLKDGFLKYADVARPFEDMFIEVQTTRDRMLVQDFRARAGDNRLSLTGTVLQPLDTNRTSFDLKFDFFADLATLKEYYPISEDTLAMRGKMTAQGVAKGTYRDLENANASGKVQLQDGYLAYKSLGSRPFEDIRFNGTISNQRIFFDEASLRAGSNRVNAQGSILNYLGSNPISDITIRTTFNLAEAGDYIHLDPQIKSLQGQAISNLTLKGPIYTFEDLHFVGDLDLNNVTIDHDSLPKPITALQAKLKFTEQRANVEQLNFNIGSSDVDINGSMIRYMALFSDKPNTTPAELVGNFKSRFLNLDEIYPMSGSEDEIILVLPNVNSKLTADIDSMVVFASPVTNLKTTIESTPKRIIMRNGSFNLFGGSIRGAFTFDVLNPRASLLDFAGQLQDIRIETFFKDFPVFGKNTRIHEFLSGGINFDTSYKTALDSYLNPETATTQAVGSIGMTEVRFRNHPVQNKIADFLKIPELKDIGLNAWTTNYVIGQSLLNLQEMRITAREFTFELDGTENLTTQEITYQTRIYLPRRYTSTLTSILPREAIEALVRPDSSIVLPLIISGTYTNPQVALNQDAVKLLVDDYVKRQVNSLEDEARQRLQNLFRRNN